MLDIKTFNSALEQLEEERGISKEKIMDAIETAIAAAYKKDYGKKGQIIRASFDPASGKAEFTQIKIVVDDSIVKMPEETEAEEMEEKERVEEGEIDARPRFNPEHHILIEDAKKIKKDVELEDEVEFPLEAKDDYGRIAAQTAKQVIIQKIREAEKVSILDEYEEKEGSVVTGIVQRIERGNVFVDLGRIVAMLPYEEQIPGEHYRQGGRIKAYIYEVSEGQRGVQIRLSRTNSQFLKKLFEVEVPEIAADTGMLTVADAMGGMDEIMGSVDKTIGLANDLKTRSKDVEKVLTVMADVTRQTNLLSINAAILADMPVAVAPAPAASTLNRSPHPDQNVNTTAAISNTAFVPSASLDVSPILSRPPPQAIHALVSQSNPLYLICLK